MVRRKRQGKTIEAPEREEAPQPAGDLMAALERSLAEVRGEGKGNGRGTAKGKGKARRAKAAAD